MGFFCTCEVHSICNFGDIFVFTAAKQGCLITNFMVFYVHWSTQFLYKTGMFDTQCLTNFMFFFYVHVKYTICLQIYSQLLQNRYVWYTQCLTNFFSKKRKKEIRSYAFIVCLILVIIFLRYSSDRFNTNILLMLKNSFHFNCENIIFKDYALNTQSGMEKGA